jgi:hypothetical protein
MLLKISGVQPRCSRLQTGFERLGLSQYARCFAENDISFVILPDLTDQDLSLAYRTIGIYVFLRTVMCSPVRASQIAHALKLPRVASTGEQSSPFWER